MCQFGDSPWETLLSLRNIWWGGGKVRGEEEEEGVGQDRYVK